MTGHSQVLSLSLVAPQLLILVDQVCVYTVLAV